MIQVVPVELRFIDAIWPDVGPILQTAIDKSRGEYQLEDIYRFLHQGTMQLLIAAKDKEIIGAVITEVVQYPRKTALQVTFLAGKHMNQWFDEVVKVTKEGAKTVGADFLQATGRFGWKKYMKTAGIKSQYITYSVKL